MKTFCSVICLASMVLWGCAGPTAKTSAPHAARTFLPLAPTAPPTFSGTYDFEFIGSAKGRACAEWAPRSFKSATHARYVRVLVDGREAHYSVAILGADLESDDPRIRQAQAAAGFAAVNSVSEGDALVLTRSLVTTESEKVCATVFGRVIRLVKGPSLLPVAAAPLPADEEEEAGEVDRKLSNRKARTRPKKRKK